jgi:5-methylcytosine-specific restriction endonuclease McrA
VGDSRQVDHKKPLVNGGTNARSNLRVVSAKSNLTKEAMRKKRNG